MDELTALRLQIEWGADEAILDTPIDRLRGGTAPAEVLSPPTTTVLPSRIDAARTSTPGEAQELAGNATSLDTLRATVAAFQGCTLRDTAAHTVLPEGQLTARLILIGEAPSADDDRAGRAFSGGQGQFLDKALSGIGLDRDELLIAPLLPWRPPGDRPPSPSELAICLPFLWRLLTLASGRRALVLGPVATRAVLGPSRRVRRGTWVELDIPNRSTKLIVLPSVSLAQTKRTPAMKRELWSDLKRMYRALNAEIAQK